MRFVYATRRSKLALAQSRAFVASLRARVPEATFEELQVVTTGDRVQDRPLYEVGGKGLFVKEIEEALLDGRADFAVHSIKDVPAELPQGLQIACIPRRSSPYDVLIVRAEIAASGAELSALPAEAKVGTSSLRRSLALSALRPDLRLHPLRGNVDTRLAKLDAAELDAIVLAEAGLLRLGLEARVSARLRVDECVPAVGQGALGIEARAGDARVMALLSHVQDTPTALAVGIERGILRALGADCRTPLAAYAELDLDAQFAPRAEAYRVRAWATDADGANRRELDERVPIPADADEADRVGRTLGARLQ